MSYNFICDEKSVHSSLVKPSVSLIKQIVYPEKIKFMTAATQWGCKHEHTAKKAYETIQRKTHPTLTINSAGFFISKKIPFVGATTDGIVDCECCGKGCIEIAHTACEMHHLKM